MRGEATTYRLGTHQNVAYTGTAGKISNAVGDVHVVRVVCTTDAYVDVSKSGTATSSSVYLPANAIEYFDITPGEKVSAIQVSTGGTLHVTECSK